jgi:uncharacterized protein (DUF433 family)
VGVTRGFSLDTTARITGVQRDRLRYWAKHGVLAPSLVYEPGVRYGYLYSFQDLVSLRTLKNLRDEYHFSLQSLRPIGECLRDFYEQPWAELKFFVYEDQLAFTDAEKQQLISASQFGQAMLETVRVDLQEVSQTVERAAEALWQRSPNDVGQIVRRRYVFQNKPVVAGTRLPISLIRQYVDEGYSVDEILETYPFLRAQDIHSALEWEAGRESVAS